MKRLLLFVKNRDWTNPIGVTILTLIYLIGQNVSASLYFDPAMREQLVIKQYFDTAGILVVVFIFTFYVEWFLEVWFFLSEYSSHHND